MAQWYAYVMGKRYGPVDEPTLRRWVDQNRVGPDDSVWSAGMADWQRLADALIDSTGPLGMKGLVKAKRRTGTNGQTPNAELTAQARGVLSGRWGTPILFCFVLGMVEGTAGSIPWLGMILALIVAGPFELGRKTFFLAFSRTQRGSIDMMFAGFRHFGIALGLHLFRGVLIGLWIGIAALPGALAGWAVYWATGNDETALQVGLALAGIPALVVGVMASLMYSRVFYLLADDPELGTMELLSESRRLMVGRKGKLFWLYGRYFLWALLCVLTLFVGFFWLRPYQGIGLAKFHDDLLPPLEGDAAASGGTAPVESKDADGGRAWPQDDPAATFESPQA